ncbi:MAG TPA: hypothetical protein VLG25_00730 [Patescibacteria group bacterium]|nr:hypothetical protein [Patescibacteria group bacterium]
MINLMPVELKHQTRFARRNTLLLRWMVSMLIGTMGIVGVFFGGQIYIQQSIHAYENQVSQTKKSLADQKLEETQKHVQDISNSVKLVNQVLSREVLFSKLIKQVGAVMPPGSALQSLSLNKIEGGIDLQAVASDYQTASQIIINLADPANKVFEKADIQSINCSSTAIDTRYPCSASIRALFAKNNPYTFVQVSSGSSK